MTITPVTPVDRERLVPVNTGLLIDARGETIAQVSVDGTQVWNGSSAIGGWSGFTIAFPGGTRLVLDPPTPFASGQVVSVVVGGSVTLIIEYLFQCGLVQVTNTDDAVSPRVTETGDRPWVVYPRFNGNIYARKDEPLTSEVPMVPGDKVDIGYNDVTGEVEIMYIHNGKVFLVVGDDTDTPSTLTQPSILKNDMKTGDVGSGDNRAFTQATFTPIKSAIIEPVMTTGGAGSGENNSYTGPLSPPALAVFSSLPVTVFIGQPRSSLVTAIQLYKIAYGGAILLAELATSQRTYVDYAWAPGDRYAVVAVYGDPGSPARRRFTARSGSQSAENGDIMLTGGVGGGDERFFSQATFAPLKRAVIEPSMTTGSTGGAGDCPLYRSWYPSNGISATLSANTSGFVVASGLSQIGRQHLGLNLTVSGSADPANNGSWLIVEIISASSVRLRALTATGLDANNGTLTWTVTGPAQVSPASFVSLNTQNIGVG